MKSKLIKTLVILLTVMIAACSDENGSNPEESARHLKQAKAYLEQGQFRAANIEARNALDKDNANIDAYVLMANMFNRLDHSNQALVQLERVPEDIRNNLYNLELAKAYIKKRKTKSATRLLNTIKPITVEEISSHAKLSALVSITDGNFIEAESQLEDLISIYPNDIEAKTMLARTYRITKKFDKLETVLSEVERLDPKNSEMLLIRASIVAEEGDYSAAEKLLTDALVGLQPSDTMTPERFRVLSALTDVLRKLGRVSEATTYARILSDEFPGAEVALSQYQEAFELYKTGDYQKSKAILESILSSTPDFEQARILLATLNYLLGNFDEASSLFAGVVDVETSNERVTQIAAISELQLSNPERVVEMLSPASDLEDARLIYLYGVAQLKLGNPDQGISFIRKAIDKDPKNSRFHLAASSYFNSIKEYDKAVAELTSALSKNERDFYVNAALLKQYHLMNNEKGKEELVNKIKRFDTDPRIMTLVGSYYESEGDLKLSGQYYSKAYQISGKVEPSVRLARVLIKQSDYQGAFNLYKELIYKDEQFLPAYRGLLFSGSRGETIDEAVALIDTASSTSAEAALVLSEYYLSENSIKVATDYLDKATANKDQIKYKRYAANVFKRFGQAMLSAEDYSRARDYSLLSYQVNANLLDIAPQMVAIEVKSGNKNEAEKILNQLSSEDSALERELRGDLEAGVDLAVALGFYQEAWEIRSTDRLGQKIYGAMNSLGKSDESAQFLSDWEIKMPQSPLNKFLRSGKYLEAGKLENAIALLEELNPDTTRNVLVLNNLAWAYQELDNPKAVNYAQRAYELKPDSAQIADTYGWALFKFGEKEKAREILKKALELDPENEDIKKHLEAAS